MLVGLALGSGSARGWAHIGIIKALKKRGIQPDVIVGTSIGALVGASLVTGSIESFEQWVESLTWRDVVGLLDVRLNGGLIHGERLLDELDALIPDRAISSLDVPYAAVATDLNSGHELWMREGSILTAVRASIALPGLFSPVQHEGKWLVDGGLVNPVPVSLCRALGAELVIAVDLNTDLLRRHQMPPGQADSLEGAEDNPASFTRRVFQYMRPVDSGKDRAVECPSIIEVMARSLNIMSVRISRSRMVGDPPDILISPRLAHIGLMEFHRAKEAIDAGEDEVDRMGDELDMLLDQL